MAAIAKTLGWKCDSEALQDCIFQQSDVLITLSNLNTTGFHLGNNPRQTTQLSRLYKYLAM